MNSSDEFGTASSASIVITGLAKMELIESRLVEQSDTGASDVRYASAKKLQRCANQGPQSGLLLCVDSTTQDAFGEALCIIIA